MYIYALHSWVHILRGNKNFAQSRIYLPTSKNHFVQMGMIVIHKYMLHSAIITLLREKIKKGTKKVVFLKLLHQMQREIRTIYKYIQN